MMFLTRQLLISFASLLFFVALNGQRTYAELSFKDGTVKKGLGKLKGNAIKFKVHKKEKAVYYDFTTVKRLKIKYNDEVTTYVSLKVKGKETPVVLEEIVVGKVNLYSTENSGYSPNLGGGFGAGGTGFSGGTYYNISNYYVLKEGEQEVIHLGSSQLFTKNFKKAASDFFKDCTKLVAKIQNRELRKKDIKEIVAFYNRECK